MIVFVNKRKERRGGEGKEKGKISIKKRSK